MKICIVGGGSAGWMSATTFVRLLDADVTLVESPDINIIGVGESTLQQLQRWIDLVGIREDEIDFMRKTNATLKHSIKLTNFLTKDSGGFHYPFGMTPHISPEDWWKYKNAHPEVSCNTYGEGINAVGLLAERGKVDVSEPYSYHFDAVKFGQYLRDTYCEQVNRISANVVDCVVNENGIKNLQLDTGESVEADLFVDCTGFKSLLLGKYLHEPFISYSDKLPNDSAWVTHIPHVNKKKMRPYTECTAINNGWVWNIPLWDSIGTGYVYSSKHISHEDAKQEFISHLGTDDCEFKHISTKIGRYNRTFVKNVVAIGLSAGFLEPLESNGLLTLHENLITLYGLLKRGKVSNLLKDYYNKATSVNFDEWADFIAVHYAFTQREDTPYWKDIFNRVYDIRGSDNYERYGLSAYTLELYKFKRFTHLHTGFHYIASGMNVSPYMESDPEIDNSEMWQKWEDIISTKPTLYEHLKNEVYVET